MTNEIPKIPKPKEKNVLEELKIMNDLQREALRFGLTQETYNINGTLLPEICKYIKSAQDSKNEEGMSFLLSELNIHGIDFIPVEGSNRQGNSTKMAYMLYKIAGLTEEEIRLDIGLGNNIINDLPSKYKEQVRMKMQERKEFLLKHPEFDHQAQIDTLGKIKLPSMEEMLKTIKDVSEVDALKIFNSKYIPEYQVRRSATTPKSTVYRTLKMVVFEIFLLLTEPNWDRILELINGTSNKKSQTRNKGRISKEVRSSDKNSMLSLDIRKAISSKRIEFQSLLVIKPNQVDKTNWKIEEEVEKDIT